MTLVLRSCACGGRIRADDRDPAGAVVMHNRSPEHEAYRLGMRLVVMREGATTGRGRDPLTLDGRPVYRLEER